MAFEIEKKTVRVTVERELQCVCEADIYLVDRYTNPVSKREYVLLWDLSDDKFAIGCGFHGMTDEDDHGWCDYACEGIHEYASKRLAFHDWVALAK